MAKVVLGIDAAWTEGKPSGVALVIKNNQKWQCVAIAPSYGSFIDIAAGKEVDWDLRAQRMYAPEKPDVFVPKLLEAAKKLAGAAVDVVTIDMPISKAEITGRREADNQVSQAFGNYQAAVYSPTENTPGQFGRDITKAFKQHGYEVCAEGDLSNHKKLLIEVYPHAALIRLLNLQSRLKYKAGKSKNYWPRASRENRVAFLIQNMMAAYHGLRERIEPAEEPGDIAFPEIPKSLAQLKMSEDALDALVCAWVGICCHQGEAEAYGDERAAIWVPVNRAWVNALLAIQE